jgi:hypothetical protein
MITYVLKVIEDDSGHVRALQLSTADGIGAVYDAATFLSFEAAELRCCFAAYYHICTCMYVYVGWLASGQLGEAD